MWKNRPSRLMRSLRKSKNSSCSWQRLQKTRPIPPSHHRVISPSRRSITTKVRKADVRNQRLVASLDVRGNCENRVAGRGLRTSKSRDPTAASAWQRRDQFQKQRYKKLGLVHQLRDPHRVPYCQDPFSIGARSARGHRFLEIVRHGLKSKEASNLASRFAVVKVSDGSRYDMSADYFRFMFNAGVEPTNNHSEQQVRHVVIDRRITQGTRSESRQRYHERMWTAIATYKKQEKNFFEYLYSSIQAKLSGTPAPSLLG